MKNQIVCMLFQQNEMCLNETDYVTVPSVINTMTAEDIKMTHKMQQ